jgi:hypothetical protein
MKLARGVVIAALLTVTACGDDTPDSTADAPAAPSNGTEYASLSDLLDSPDADDGTVVVVSTILFDDGTGPVMCEALAESFPPQCVGRTLELDIEILDVEWTEQEGIRWTDRPVSLLGWVDGAMFVVT